MKKILTVMFAVLLISAPAVSVSAVEYDYKDDPYKTYTYDSNNNPLAIPSAFSYKGKITGEDINGVKFGELADIFYSKEEDKIYIIDSV